MSFSKYPEALDDSTSLPVTLDLITPVKAEVVNRQRDAILAIQAELGLSPSSVYGTVDARLDDIDVRINTISGDSGFGNLDDRLIVVESIVTKLDVVPSTVNALVRFDTTNGGLKDSPNGPYVIDDGSLGIGISTPSLPLHVVGNAGVTGNLGVGNISPALALDVTGDINVSGFVRVGTNPAQSGAIRFANNTFVRARNAANNADLNVLTVDGSNNLIVGQTASGNPATSVTADTNVILLTGGATRLRANTSIIEIIPTQLGFISTTVSPIILQSDDTTNSITGDTLLVHSQDATGTTTTGGDLHLRPGTGTSAGGELELQDSAGTARVLVSTLNDVTINGASNNFIQVGSAEKLLISNTQIRISTDLLSFVSTSSSPVINQADDINNSITGDTLLIHSQDAPGTTTTGGDLHLRPGTGTTANGSLVLQDGLGAAQITITDGLATIASGLSVTTFVAIGATPAQSGALRLTNNETISSRNAADSADETLLFLDGSNNLILGQTSGNIANVIMEAPTGSVLRMRVNAVTMVAVNVSQTVLTPASLAFAATTVSPVINQDDETGGSVTGDTLLIHAQDSTGVTSIGGALDLRPGSGTSTNGQLALQDGTGADQLTVNDGLVNIVTAESFGASPAGAGEIRFGTTGAINFSNSGDIRLIAATGSGAIAIGQSSGVGAITYDGTQHDLNSSGALVARVTSTTVGVNVNNLQFIAVASVPVISQVDQTGAGTSGTLMTMSAQDSTGTGVKSGGGLTVRAGDASGGTDTGGALTLRSGDGGVDNGSVSLDSGTVGGTGRSIVFYDESAADTLVFGGTGLAAGFTRPSQTRVESSGSVSLSIGGGNNFIVTGVAASLSVPSLTWTAAVASPVINQTASSVSDATGDLFTITSQDVTGAGTTITGGAMLIRAGDASGAATTDVGGAITIRPGSGTTTDGELELQAGDGSVALTVDINGAVQIDDWLGVSESTGLLAGAGSIRLPNTGSVQARSTTGASVPLISIDAGDNIIFGTTSSIIANFFLDGDSASNLNFRTGGTARLIINATSATLGVPLLQFEADEVTPIIRQLLDATADATGDLFTINAQDVSGSGTTITGGAFLLRAGNASGAATSDIGGAMTIRPGSGTTTDGILTLEDGGSTSRVLIDAAGNTTIDAATALALQQGAVGVMTLQQAAITLVTGLVQWGAGTATPQLVQATQVGGTGELFTIHAQDTGVGGTGGAMIIRPGQGDTLDGVLELQAGDGTAGFTIDAAGQATVNGANSVFFHTGSVQRAQLASTVLRLSVGIFDFTSTIPSPVITHADDATNSITGDTLLIHAQNATGTTTVGGDLTLNAGSGTTTDGEVNIGDTNTSVINIGNVTDNPTINLIGSGDFGLSGDIVFEEDQVTPMIYHEDEDDAGIDGDLLTIHAQDSISTGTKAGGEMFIRGGDASGGTDTGGALTLRSGDGGVDNGLVSITSGTAGGTGRSLVYYEENAGDQLNIGGTGVAAGFTRPLNIIVDASSLISFRITNSVASFSSTALSLVVPTFQFTTAVVSPVIAQQGDGSTDATGDLMLIHSQDVSGAGTTNIGGALTIRAGDSTAGSATNETGGAMTIRPGDGGTGSGLDGRLDLQTGSGVNRFSIDGLGDVDIDCTTNIQMRVGTNLELDIASNAVQVFADNLFFDRTALNPEIYQANDTDSNTTGDLLTIRAQGVTGAGTTNVGGAMLIHGGDSTAGSATNETGGALTLRPGAGGTGSGVDGILALQDGSANNRIRVLADGTVRISIPSTGTNAYLVEEGSGEDYIRVSTDTPTITFGNTTNNPVFIFSGTGGMTFGGSPWSFAEDVVGPIINQIDEDDAGISGDLLTIHSQDSTSTGAKAGGAMLIRAGDATGGTDTGGAITIRPGAGASSDGILALQDGSGNNRITINAAGLVEVDSATQFSIRIGSVVQGAWQTTQLRVAPPLISWDSPTASPQLMQDDEAGAGVSGELMTIRAQDSTGTGVKSGGALTIRAGDASGGTDTGGVLTLEAGGGDTWGTVNIVDGGGTTRMQVTSGGVAGLGAGNVMSVLSSIITTSANTFQWTTGATPVINQANEVGSGISGDLFTIHAQDSTGTGVKSGGAMLIRAGDATGGTDTGGALTLRPGGATTDGVFEIQDGGGTKRIRVTAAGDLELGPLVQGTLEAAGAVTATWDVDEVRMHVPNFRWTSSANTPTITHLASTTATGELMSISSQDTSFAGANAGGLNISAGDSTGTGVKSGGALTVRAGDASNGTDTGGDLTLRPGLGDTNGQFFVQNGSGGIVFRIDENDRIEFNTARIDFDTTVSSPLFTQEDESGAGTSGELMTFRGQSSLGTGTKAGGALTISGGLVSGGTIDAGGAVIITGGNSTSAGTTGGGGQVTLKGGNAVGATTDSGGGVIIQGGTGDGPATHGAIRLVTGDGTTRITVTTTSALCNLPAITFDDTVVAPTISQESIASGSGDIFTISAQSISTATGTVAAGTLRLQGGAASGTSTQNTGGGIAITGGTSTNAGTNIGGSVTIRGGVGDGASTNGTTTIQDGDGTARLTVGTIFVEIGYASIFFEESLVTPLIGQTATAADGEDLFIQAQESTSNAGTGGDLHLLGGAGTHDTAGNGGHVLISGGVNDGTGLEGNVAFNALPASWNSGEEIIFIGDRAAAPTGDPASGGYMYSESGAGKWRGSSGTITTFGPAHPHCPDCGRDCAVEFVNEAQGWDIAVCMWCITDALDNKGVIRKDQK